MADKKAPPRCNGCNALIHFQKKLDGSEGWMVLSKVKSAYVEDDRGFRKANVGEGAAIFVSHFEVCPKADEYSRSKRG
jgi:hypothetical protein